MRYISGKNGYMPTVVSDSELLGGKKFVSVLKANRMLLRISLR